MSKPQSAEQAHIATNASRFIYALYQCVQILLSPLLLLYLLYRGLRDPRYFSSMKERFGFLPAHFETTSSGSVWFHAVSVGEVLSAVELIRRVRQARPDVEIFVSTATLTGREAADQRLLGGGEPLADGVFFAPLDYKSVIRRVVRKIRPAAVVILETEIWPNLYRESVRSGASLMVVNGRISDEAMPKYARWSSLLRHVLCWPGRILVQSQRDRERYIALGAPENRVECLGNLKYDLKMPGEVTREIKAVLSNLEARSVWVAASTMPPVDAGDVDEDDQVIAAFQQITKKRADLLLVLAPRHPERFDAVAQKLERARVPYVRRSQLTEGIKLELPGVLLLDSIGELAAVFGLASVVFMGGTLARRGGHNILEPAQFAKPVIAGPHMENFPAIAVDFRQAGALVEISGPSELAGAVTRLLDDPGQAVDIGNRAKQLADAGRGVVDRVASLVLDAIDRGIPDPRRVFPLQWVLGALTHLWAAGHRMNIARGQRNARRLGTRVVSIGGISMGGAGKSPMVAHLAQRLHEMGREPAILTRGYRKKSSKPAVVVPRGAAAGLEETGDEAQAYVRQGAAHIGIGAERYHVGRMLEQELAPDLFLLDDGFQHVRLRRNEDIVLVSALNPLSGGLFPLGRRREPLEGMARATAIVITRVADGQKVTGIEAMIRRYNSTAPIYRCSVVPEAWIDVRTGESWPVNQPPFQRAVAFCGLGSPRSFWRTLSGLERAHGIRITARRAFADHHGYSADEIARLAADARASGATALVTTGKDVMNLPVPRSEEASVSGSAVPVYYLKIGIEIEREAELLAKILGEPVSTVPPKQ